MHISKLRWQCRRGMRELDELLLAYLDTHYAAASSADKEAFEALLVLSDPELAGYLLNRQTAAAGRQRVIDHILGRTET